MPDVDTVRSWQGATMVDPDGDKLGTIESIYVDDQTGQPEWVLVTTGLVGSRSTFVPIAQATASSDQVQVPYQKQLVKDAPSGCLGQAPGPTRMLQPAGADYYQYFAGRTPPHPGYYSFNAEAWHFVVLNTTCTVVPGGCSGAMLDWLKADLAANKLGCTVVVGHSPYLSSAAPSYGTPDLSAIWPTLVLNDVDCFLPVIVMLTSVWPESGHKATWTKTGAPVTGMTATPACPSSSPGRAATR